MWSKERHQQILALLKSNQLVSANDLAGLLNVSRETVRRDLVELEGGGLVNRVHGGAVLPTQRAEDSFEKRLGAQMRAKQDIARKAVSLIPTGASIMVDAGTTTSVFGQALTNLSGIMVLTNSLDIAQTIKASGADIELILLGGQMLSDVPATFGEMALAQIQRFKVDLAFVAPVAMHATEGAFSFDLREAEIARAMIKQASENVFLCDRTKLGITNRVQICETSFLHTLVTDSRAQEEQSAPFRTLGTKVLI